MTLFRDFSVKRRDFMKSVLAAGACILTGHKVSPIFANASGIEGERQLYSFFLLGDTHYDKLEYHDANWANNAMPAGIWGEFENYSKVTKHHTPLLFQRLRQKLDQSTTPVAGVIQVGDFVEGVCGSYELQCMQSRGFIEFVSTYFSPATKFLVTKGNHEITGPDSGKAYNDVILPWQSKQLGKEVKSASHCYTFDKDLFIFFDCINPDLDWLDSVLSKTSARHKFLITHYPVVPFSVNWNLSIFARDSKKRQRLQNMLGKHSVIVLCGHWHQHSVLSRKTENGNFIQVSIFSVISSKNVKATGFISGKEHYKANWELLKERHGSTGTALRKELLEAEWPFIDFYEFATMPSHCHIKVYDEKIICDVSIADNSEVWRSYAFSNKGEVLSR